MGVKSALQMQFVPSGHFQYAEVVCAVYYKLVIYFDIKVLQTELELRSPPCK